MMQQLQANKIAKVRKLFNLSLTDQEIVPHLERAEDDSTDVEFESKYKKDEAISCLTIYYVAPLLWVEMQNKADEYQESLRGFNDIKDFQQYWYNRAMSVKNKTNNQSEKTGAIRWQAI